MSRNRPILVLTTALLALSLSTGCSPKDAGAENSGKAGVAASQVPAGRFAGRVVETMDVGGYTYVSLEKDGERIWAAGPETAVAVGDEMTVDLSTPMLNFESPTLGRTFDTIYFVNALAASPMAAAPSAADPHGTDPQGTDPHAGIAKTAPVSTEAIAKPEGGYSIAELWERRAELAGQEVAVSGRVVKYNSGILGRNWLHIQDGSGDPASGTHDLTVTADAPSAEGELVTVRGVVAVDQDFGAGYSYDLIVEQASLQAWE